MNLLSATVVPMLSSCGQIAILFEGWKGCRQWCLPFDRRADLARECELNSSVIMKVLNQRADNHSLRSPYLQSDAPSTKSLQLMSMSCGSKEPSLTVFSIVEIRLQAQAS